ncbi:alpha/beta fold hydrolase [Streptomyces chartreusis]|uniref:alpha/beta fold hydrolase n=1 Tax=Streptomyces chartreusis TaxID=1969 RepID=UPI0036430EDA
MSWTRSTIDAGGFHTGYLEASPEAKETVVLIHDGGYGTTADLCWGEVIDHLADKYHVLAPELLGWGETDKVVYFDRPPYAGRIPHIAAFCRAMGVSSATFVGASFGGSVLLRALVDARRPWPIDRAISISGTGGPFRDPKGTAALAEYEPSLEAAERMTGLIVRDTANLSEHIRRRYDNSLAAGHWEALTAPRLHNPATERPAPADDFLDRFATLSVPVLLVEGRHDPLLEDGWSKKLADLSPSARSLIVDYSHEPNIEAPAETARIISEFIEGAGA